MCACSNLITMATESCHLKEPNSHVKTWLCNQTGILPSQYACLAVDKLTESIVDTLEAMRCTGTCSQGMSAHSAFLQEISTMCLPILLNPKALPLVEKLICCQSHCTDLSHDFLVQVTVLQRGEGDYLEPPKLDLTYETRVKLWATYLPSFSQELIDLVKAVSSMGLSQGELGLVISARNVPRACLEHYHLLLYTEEVLKVLFINANGSKRIKQVINSFNHQLSEASRRKSLSASPLHCPRFDYEWWMTPQQQTQTSQKQ